MTKARELAEDSVNRYAQGACESFNERILSNIIEQALTQHAAELAAENTALLKLVEEVGKLEADGFKSGKSTTEDIEAVLEAYQAVKEVNNERG